VQPGGGRVIVPKTLASDEVWYPANACCGRLLFKTGAASYDANS
jgi:hypothetical protein